MLKNTELTTEDIVIYTKIPISNTTHIINDLKRWNDIRTIRTDINYITKKKRQVYTITKKGKEKLNFFKNKYNFRWKPEKIF